MLYETNLRELYEKLSESSTFSVTAQHGTYALKSPVSHPALNTAFGVLEKQSLISIANFFDTTSYCLLIDANNSATYNLLAHHEFTPQAALPEMVLDLGNYKPQISPEEITIVPVETILQFEQWCAIASHGLEVPLKTTTEYNRPIFEYRQNDALLYLGYCKNIPVATAMIHVGSETLSISSVAVKPEFRRRGIATAMTHACLTTPRPEAVTTAVLIGFTTARVLYEKIGFVLSRYIRAFSKL